MAEDQDWEDLVAGLSADPDGQWTWLTLPEASAEAGVSRSTLRAWYRSGQIPSQLEAGPHGPQRLVPRELVFERALKGRGRLDAPEPTRTVETATSAIEAVLADASRREERLQARIVSLEHEVRQLLVRLALVDRPDPRS
jgi:hypothetical protein